MFTPRIFSALLFLAALCSAGVASAQIHADSLSSFDSTGLRGKIETELEYLAPTDPSREIPLHPKQQSTYTIHSSAGIALWME